VNISIVLRVSLVFTGTLMSGVFGFSQAFNTEQQVQITLRRVGHHMLLASGDSTSRVLPIEKMDNRYKVPFAAEFAFDPDQIITLVDSLVQQAGIANGYIVEMEECSTGNVVHSYEVSSKTKKEDVACKGRTLPKACYNLFFTILDENNQPYALHADSAINTYANTDNTSGTNYIKFGLLGILLLVVAILYMRRRRHAIAEPIEQEEPVEQREPEQANNEHIIAIGAYQFNKHNMTLSMNNESVELTGKESDLLLLLHTSANHTIDRDVILNEVWGDEGDYIGRTLDVFISKLRKRLEGDPNLKIVNIRGVGYKLIVDR